MSRTDDILDKTKRKEPEAKKWKVVVGIVIGLVLVFSVYFGIYCFADVDTYLETKEIVRLYDFYDLKVGENETAVYILGDSFVS